MLTQKSNATTNQVLFVNFVQQLSIINTFSGLIPCQNEKLVSPGSPGLAETML